jgi:hypothetical protein
MQYRRQGQEGGRHFRHRREGVKVLRKPQAKNPQVEVS